MKWKYQVISEKNLRCILNKNEDLTLFEEEQGLCFCGNLGWELIKILIIDGEKIYYFKKPLEEKLND